MVAAPQCSAHGLAVGAVGGSGAHGKAHSAANQGFFSYGSLKRDGERGPIGSKSRSAAPASRTGVWRMAAGLCRWSGMKRLGIAAGFGFGLKRGMVNFEFLFEHFRDRNAGIFTHCLWLQNEVGCQAGIVSCHRPQMQVVDARDTRHPKHRATDSFKIKPARNALKKDVRGIAQQSPCARQNP